MDRYIVEDNTNSLGIAGWELVDTQATPPRTIAIGMPKDDAERAAAALNACIGIDTELLQPRMLGDQIAAKQALIDERELHVERAQSLMQTEARVRAERREILKALIDIVDTTACTEITYTESGEDVDREIKRRVQATIDKYRGT